MYSSLGGSFPVTGRTCNPAIVRVSCVVGVLSVEKVTVAVVLVTTMEALVISFPATNDTLHVPGLNIRELGADRTNVTLVCDQVKSLYPAVDACSLMTILPNAVHAGVVASEALSAETLAHQVGLVMVTVANT